MTFHSRRDAGRRRLGAMSRTEASRGQLVIAAPLHEMRDLRARAIVLSRRLPVYAIVGRRTAAWLWGLDVLPPGVSASSWPVEVLVPPGRSPLQREGCRCYIADYEADDVGLLDGTRLTSRERTALDCARWLPRLQAVAALDQFLRAGVEPGVLTARAAVLAGERNSRQLREVLALGDRGAVLPGESWTRAVIVDTGFPRPRTQVSVPGPLGTNLFIDLGYREYRVGVEYDGERHHMACRDRERDEARRRWLRKELGWELIVVTKSDVLATPYPFLAALMTALFERGWSPDDDELTDICTRLDRLKRRRRSRALR
jgi:hypothetical protein